jgi:MFS family permease
MMTVGFVYFVFAPSFLTTPLAGKMAARLGTRTALWSGLGLATIGLPLMLVPRLELVIVGMILAGVGIFFAQAVATGFVGRAATTERGAASGMYLACYFAADSQARQRSASSLTVSAGSHAFLVSVSRSRPRRC